MILVLFCQRTSGTVHTNHLMKRDTRARTTHQIQATPKAKPTVRSHLGPPTPARISIAVAAHLAGRCYSS